MTSVSTSAAVRSRLSHPVLDADGHVVEYMPLVRQYLREEGGSKLADALFRESRWYELTDQERQRERFLRPPWWGIPTKLTIDNATSMLPRLLSERMSEMGLDFTVLYPTRGLRVPHFVDEFQRRASCRAFNRYLWDVFSPYAAVMTPAAIIPMHTPDEAIEELEFAVGNLGFKAIVMAGYVRRPIEAVVEKAGSLGRHATYIDMLGMDSKYDYDPVWDKCVQLGVAPTFHSAGMGWGSRTSPSNYMYNHIGHFASASEGLCKALFMGGVTRRFPTLRFAFLESGVGWATNLFSDLIGHWEKRNAEKMVNYDPKNFDRELFESLFDQYAEPAMKELSNHIDEVLEQLGPESIAAPYNDEFAAAQIRTKEDIKDLFVPSFFFGCEADDPINAYAFNTKNNPMHARLNAIFSSDIGHWDVPDMREVLEEAYELVEDELVDEADFRDFVFANAARMFTSMNPDFFKGTVIEDSVSSGGLVLDQAR